MRKIKFSFYENLIKIRRTLLGNVNCNDLSTATVIVKEINRLVSALRLSVYLTEQLNLEVCSVFRVLKALDPNSSFALVNDEQFYRTSVLQVTSITLVRQERNNAKRHSCFAFFSFYLSSIQAIDKLHCNQKTVKKVIVDDKRFLH